MAKYRVGEAVRADGKTWYLVWIKYRDPSTGKNVWLAEDELGESRLIELN
jgi:hypothetical protein